MLELYGISGPEFYWKDARAAMLIKGETRRPLALHMRRGAHRWEAWRRREGRGSEKKTCACAWHLLRIRAGVLLPPPPLSASVALRCVAPRESGQFNARLGAGPHPVAHGTRACACAPGS